MLAFLFMLLSHSTFASTFNIMIDPGHGGHDHGAVRGAYKESEIVLVVSQKLKKLLDQNSKFKTSLTRYSDEALSLEARTNLAKSFKADLFLSVHVNTSLATKVWGTEIYLQNQLPPDEESMLLASKENEGASLQTESKGGDIHSILDDLHKNYSIHQSFQFVHSLFYQWKKNFPGQKVSVRQAPFFVLASNEVPSVLVELGYLSHAEEALRLNNSSFQNQMAEALYKSVLAYTKKNSSTPPRIDPLKE